MFEFLKKKKLPAPAEFCWLSTLYLGDSVRDRVEQIREDIILGKEFEGPIVLTLATSEKNQLDLIPVRELLHPYYRNRHMKIIGLAGGRDEADRILLEILQECLNSRGDADMRAYLETCFEKEAEV